MKNLLSILILVLSLFPLWGQTQTYERFAGSAFIGEVDITATTQGGEHRVRTTFQDLSGRYTADSLNVGDWLIDTKCERYVVVFIHARTPFIDVELDKIDVSYGAPQQGGGNGAFYSPSVNLDYLWDIQGVGAGVLACMNEYAINKIDADIGAGEGISLFDVTQTAHGFSVGDMVAPGPGGVGTWYRAVSNPEGDSIPLAMVKAVPSANVFSLFLDTITLSDQSALPVGDIIFLQDDATLGNTADTINLPVARKLNTFNQFATINWRPTLGTTGSGGGSNNKVDSIQYVSDTTALVPFIGDEFVNSTYDTTGVYGSDRWYLRLGHNPPFTEANTLYVDPNGDNATAQKGRQDLPYANPWIAKEVTIPNDLLHINSGVYNNGDSINLWGNQTRTIIKGTLDIDSNAVVSSGGAYIFEGLNKTGTYFFEIDKLNIGKPGISPLRVGADAEVYADFGEVIIANGSAKTFMPILGSLGNSHVTFDHIEGMDIQGFLYLLNDEDVVNSIHVKSHTLDSLDNAMDRETYLYLYGSNNETLGGRNDFTGLFENINLTSTVPQDMQLFRMGNSSRFSTGNKSITFNNIKVDTSSFYPSAPTDQPAFIEGKILFNTNIHDSHIDFTILNGEGDFNFFTDINTDIDSSIINVDYENVTTNMRLVGIDNGVIDSSKLNFTFQNAVVKNDVVVSVEDITIDGESRISLTGDMETRRAGFPVIWTEHDLYLNNVRLKNDGTVASIQAPAAVTIYVSGVFEDGGNNIISDPNVTIVRLPEYGATENSSTFIEAQTAYVDPDSDGTGTFGDRNDPYQSPFSVKTDLTNANNLIRINPGTYTYTGTYSADGSESINSDSTTVLAEGAIISASGLADGDVAFFTDRTGASTTEARVLKVKGGEWVTLDGDADGTFMFDMKHEDTRIHVDVDQLDFTGSGNAGTSGFDLGNRETYIKVDKVIAGGEYLIRNFHQNDGTGVTSKNKSRSIVAHIGEYQGVKNSLNSFGNTIIGWEGNNPIVEDSLTVDLSISDIKTKYSLNLIEANLDTLSNSSIKISATSIDGLGMTGGPRLAVIGPYWTSKTVIDNSTIIIEVEQVTNFQGVIIDMESIELDSSTIIFRIQKGHFLGNPSNGAYFEMSKGVDLRNNSRIIIDCVDCTFESSDVTDNFLWIDDFGNGVSTDATSFIEMRGRITTPTAADILQIEESGVNVILRNFFVENDGSNSAIESTVAATILTAGAFDLNTITADPDITFTRLDEYGATGGGADGNGLLSASNEGDTIRVDTFNLDEPFIMKGTNGREFKFATSGVASFVGSRTASQYSYTNTGADHQMIFANNSTGTLPVREFFREGWDGSARTDTPNNAPGGALWWTSREGGSLERGVGEITGVFGINADDDFKWDFEINAVDYFTVGNFGIGTNNGITSHFTHYMEDSIRFTGSNNRLFSDGQLQIDAYSSSGTSQGRLILPTNTAIPVQLRDIDPSDNAVYSGISLNHDGQSNFSAADGTGFLFSVPGANMDIDADTLKLIDIPNQPWVRENDYVLTSDESGHVEPSLKGLYSDTTIFVTNNDILSITTFPDHEVFTIHSTVTTASSSDNDIVLPTLTAAMVNRKFIIVSDDTDTDATSGDNDTAVSSASTIISNGKTISGYIMAAGEVITVEVIDDNSTYQYHITSSVVATNVRQTITASSPTIQLERGMLLLFDADTQGATTNTLATSDLEDGDMLQIVIIGADSATSTLDLDVGDIVWNTLAGDATEAFSGARHSFTGTWDDTNNLLILNGN